MQPNQTIPQRQPLQQNSSMQNNYSNQTNYQMQQNQQQVPQNYQMQQTQQQNLQNYQMQQNYPNQQNFQMQQNQQMQQNFQMQQNPQMHPNCQMQQNQQIPQNTQMQQNCQNQQINAPIAKSQSRPLPPPIPRNSSQNLYPSMRQMSSQQIPLRATASMQSNGSMSLQQSMKYSSMQSMQSIGSSDSEEQQEQYSLSKASSTQTFPVLYNNITYKVDPELLSNASPKFKEMIQPFIQQNRLGDAHLEIFCHNFTYRNMNNFLKLCQNLPTDVENSEMEEICEIAKLFGAEKIYNTGVTFIRQNIDQNFSVPDNKYDGSDGKRYLFIEDEKHVISHSDEMQSNMANDDDNADEDDENSETKQNPAPIMKPVSEQNDDLKSKDKSKIGSVIYSVKFENHTFRCPIYRFYDEKGILFTAKQKANNIYIGKGYDVHISKNKENHVAHIYQDDNLHNIVFLKDNKFKVKYVNSGKPNHLSIDVTFPMSEDKDITWTPKQPKYDPMTDKYYLNFHGEHHHTPIKSRKNIVLQNANGHPTFIVRKMNNEMYEIECLPLVDPLIVFIIGLSDIVGPYCDPLGDIEF